MNTARKKLKTVQHTAMDKENLTGRQTKLKFPNTVIIKKEIISAHVAQKKSETNKSDKGIQANLDIAHVIEQDLTSEGPPSEQYWEIIAEKRRLALEDSLVENHKLYERIELLEEEIRVYKDMLEDTKNLVEVLNEMHEAEDSAIDLRDVSTADESEDIIVPSSSRLETSENADLPSTSKE